MTTLELALRVLSFLLLPTVLAEVFFMFRARSLVKGTRQRYVALTARRFLAWAVIGMFLLSAVLHGLYGSWITAALHLFIGIVTIVAEETHRDDDDWFNGRWNKIKNGVKSYFQSFSPSFAPSAV